MVSEEAILNALREIIDPDLGKDIVSLGFIKNLKNENGNISFDIELTTPACPVKDEFKSRAEKLVRALEGVRSLKIGMTAQKKKTVFDPARAKSGTHKIDKFIAISSCKGGVGKSTVAVGLAKDMAARGFRIGLLDADLFGPSVPLLFGLQGEKLNLTAEHKLLPIEKEGVKIISFGFLMGDTPAVMRGPMVSNYIHQLVHQVQWDELDYLFIDMPPGTGDIQLTLTQAIALDGAVIITTPHRLSLADVGKGIMMFEKVKVPLLGVIENMAFFHCPDNGKRYHLFGTEAAKKIRERFGVPLLGELPIHEDFDVKAGEKIHNAVFTQVVDNVMRALGKAIMDKESRAQLTIDQDGIELSWKSGCQAKVDFLNLRFYCNSALNVDEYTGKRKIKREAIEPGVYPKQAMPLGNYALHVEWSDGHRSIFPYDYFIELAREHGQLKGLPR